MRLAQLNEATLAWVEMEYNRKVHAELGRPPLESFIHDRDVGRPCPGSEELRMAFTTGAGRTQRRSDGTVSVEGIRFELPSRYRQLQRVSLRYASPVSHALQATGGRHRTVCFRNRYSRPTTRLPSRIVPHLPRTGSVDLQRCDALGHDRSGQERGRPHNYGCRYERRRLGAF
jgi:hypothetical protein